MKRKYITYLGLFLLVSIVGWLGYCGLSRKSYSQIPIVLGTAGTPLAEVEIQGKKYLLEVDFGSKFQLTLNQKILAKLEKKPFGTLQSRDAQGNCYESPAYTISKIKLGRHTFEDVVVKEVNEAYTLNTTLFSRSEKEQIISNRLGTIGRGTLEKMNLLLDFSNSLIFECDKIDDLRKEYQVENFTSAPFEIGRTGAVLTINTDLGKVRLSLDTGSTLTLIRSSFVNTRAEKQTSILSYYTSSSFEIGDRNFGSASMHLYDITPELHEIDGMLGMDFLKNHIVYLDYKNKMAYIGDSSSKEKKSSLVVAGPRN